MHRQAAAALIQINARHEWTAHRTINSRFNRARDSVINSGWNFVAILI